LKTAIMQITLKSRDTVTEVSGSEAASRLYIQSALALTALVVAFWPILASMYGSWFDEHAYMEHGILVIPAAAYMTWTKRAKLKRITVAPSGWGVAFLVWGGVLAIVGVAAQWTWVSRTAFIVSVIGCLAALYGFGVLRELTYPIATLLLMVAPPTFVFERLTLWLQLLSSRLGEMCLELFGYSVFREGNILQLVGIRLSVEEACSGMRSLFSILFMCVLYNYFFVRGARLQWLILIAAVPIAILGNAARILATGIASQYDPNLVRGAAHEAFGYVSVVIAALGCVVLHLTAIYVQREWRSRHA
jgi:exosortase